MPVRDIAIQHRIAMGVMKKGIARGNVAVLPAQKHGGPNYHIEQQEGMPALQKTVETVSRM